jgi:hypothetical protein
MTGNDPDHMPTDWDALVDRSPTLHPTSRIKLVPIGTRHRH